MLVAAPADAAGPRVEGEQDVPGAVVTRRCQGVRHVRTGRRARGRGVGGAGAIGGGVGCGGGKGGRRS